MKQLHWKPFALFGLVVAIMVGLMALFSFVLGGPNPMMSSSMGLGMWGVMILPLAALLVMPVMMFFFFRLMSGSRGPVATMMGRPYEQQSRGVQGNLTALTLNVPGVTCGHCKMKIEQALGDLPGVASTNVDLDARQVVIQLVSPPTRTEIEALLTESGYPPESM